VVRLFGLGAGIKTASLYLAAVSLEDEDDYEDDYDCKWRLRVGDAVGVDGVRERSDRPFMVKIEIEYNGRLQTEALHVPSGNRILTDAPVDNGGKGSTFSPTDLVATALGTCMVTVMGIFAERHKVDLTGTKVSVAKEMLQEPVRRIKRLTVDITVPLPATHPKKSALEKAALTCPVHQSLHPDVEIPINFHWKIE
jgi:putative redox protein